MKSIAKDLLPAIIERLRNGTTALLAESKALGFTHNGPLRAALREMLGRAGYDEMLQAKRPAMKTGVASTPKVSRPRIDESDVPQVASMRIADGWSWRRVGEHEPRPVKIDLGKNEGTATVQDCGERIVIMKSPDGVEYVQAGGNEKAALLRQNPIDPSAPFRFVEWEKSDARRRIERTLHTHGKLIERAEEAKEAKSAQAAPVVPPEPAPVAKKATKKPAKVKDSTKAMAAAFVKVNTKTVVKKAAKKTTKKDTEGPASLKRLLTFDRRTS